MAHLPAMFDVTKYFGAGSNERPDFPTAADLLAHLDRLGIARALTWHVLARDLHPLPGNQRLLEEIAATPGAADRLVPAFVIAPTLLYETGGMEELKRQMTASGGRALRVFRERWSLLQLEPVVRELLPLKPVVLVDAREGLDAHEFLDFATALPGVPIIILHTMWGHQVALFDLMRRCPNIYADTSWMHTAGTFEMLSKSLGTSRLVFGAGWRAHAGAAIGTLAHARISETERAGIADGNLAGLLGLAPEAAGRAPGGNTLWRAFLNGASLGTELIDAHGHLGAQGFWVSENTWMLHEQAAEYVRVMDNLGIRTAVVSGEEALFGDAVEGNQYLCEGTRAFGDRFRGYLGFHPLYADALVERFDAFFADPFFIGFKILCDYWRIPVTDPRFAPAWAYADAHRLPILLHTWNGPYDDPAMLTEIAPAYPNAKFLLGHSGGGDRTSAETLALANPNVYLEWCGSFCTRQSWEETLTRVSHRQVVFGTDGNFHDPAWELARLLSLDVPESMLLPILGDNMRGILAQRT